MSTCDYKERRSRRDRRRAHQSWVHVVVSVQLLMMWLLGIVIAKTHVWAAIIFPPYSWYLVVEMLCNKYNMIP